VKRANQLGLWVQGKRIRTKHNRGLGERVYRVKSARNPPKNAGKEHSARKKKGGKKQNTLSGVEKGLGGGVDPRT